MKPEQSHLPEEFKEFQREIELLTRTDFSRGSAARHRVQARLERTWYRLPWWRLIWHGFSDFQTRVALASVALLIFGVLNVEGIFALPQATNSSQTIPTVGVQMIRVTDSKVLGTISPKHLLTTETPQIKPDSTLMLPTPMPVPAPQLIY